ncbi:MAG: N-acetylneuraminate synthase family protein, partial [Pontibacterium sp.]
MVITRKISDFLVFEYEPLLHALSKINQNRNRIAFVVNTSGQLIGSMTDGDFRRWLISEDNFDLDVEVGHIITQAPVSLPVDTPRPVIEEHFRGPISVLPLLDNMRRPVAVALKGQTGIEIANFSLNETSPAFIIAEIGNNHNGSIDAAKQLVDAAVAAGADCAKFQMRSMDELYKKSQSSDLGNEYTLDLLNRFQLSNKELFGLFDYCKAQGILPLCTPWDLSSLRELETYGMQAYKVASADLTNDELLCALAATEKPLICSTGMSKESEIKHAVQLLQQEGAEFILLHCNSTYPTPLKDVNLHYMKRLAELSNSLVGYSGHERGTIVPVAAVSLGAKVIEKHITLDQSWEGTDHKVSLLPDEFKQMCTDIRAIETALGSAKSRELSQGEMMNREVLAKSLVAKNTLKSGQTITRADIDIVSPGQGLQPCYLDELLGKPAVRDIEEGDFFYTSDLKTTAVQAKQYEFDRPFGIPVRYHDVEKLKGLSNLDFVEFHLSYKDMELTPSDFIKPHAHLGFSVHAPELFKGDHTLDLATDDLAYRDHSISELQRVINITRDLKALLPNTETPFIVVNAGGFNTGGFVRDAKKGAMYQRVADALAQLDSDGVELVIQTMPPFPWHFGGQSHHNLFVSSQEIVDFCA